MAYNTIYETLTADPNDLVGALASIRRLLPSVRGWVGCATSRGNLIVNVVTILVIGALVLGYKFIGEVQQHAEIKAGVGTSKTPGDPAPNSNSR